MPSYEIIINRNYNEFSDVWNECKIPLYRHSRTYMEQHQRPLKIKVGDEFTAYRPKPTAESDNNIEFLHDEHEE